jgi:hypothetical protein
MKTNQLIKKQTIITLFFAIFTSFILSAQSTVKASDIMNDILNGKDVSYENVTISGVLDMTYMQDKIQDLPKKRRWYKNGGSNSIEQQIDTKVSFTNCVFEDNVYAYYHDEDSGYTFIANFEDDTKFSNCTFKGEALFKYSDFERDADFSGSSFAQRTTFKYADFDENVSFANTRFEEDAVFKYTSFRDGVSFNNAAFEDDLDIKYMDVRGEFDIKNMSVANDIDSKYTEINGKGFNKYLLNSKN